MLTDRQQNIVEAAMHIVVEQGTHKLTIRNVAAAIGVSEPAVYRHFASKHDLLVALLQNLQQSIVPLFSETGMTEKPFDRFIESFLSMLFSRIESNPAFALFVFTEEAFHADAQLRPLLARMLDDMISLLEKIIIKFQAENGCRSDIPAHTIATMLLGTIRLTVTQWHLRSEGPLLSQKTQTLVPSIVKLFTPR
ncbi:TetR/AcrR family transcriptional regulator [Pleomorphochaeta sp. DL1XJH-081]|uniref:TetR/AcrR family transcriptional regulator n=1 Tax=Pleomorphochaeta sp. DL1XJH-081 TaxID=3409690 RepID=UPI003BB5C688